MSNPLTKFDDSKDLIVFGDLPELLKPMQEKSIWIQFMQQESAILMIQNSRQN